MNNWILACGREGQIALPDVIPAGARSLSLAGASGLFAPPQKLFISEAGGAEAEWLGRVTQATASTLAFSRAVGASKNSGALLWRPACALEFPPEAAFPERIVHAGGVGIERTAGGAVYAVQTAEAQKSMRLRFSDLEPLKAVELLAWLGSETGWGIESFTLVSPLGSTAIVRLSSDPVFQESNAQMRCRVILPLLVEQEGAAS